MKRIYFIFILCSLFALLACFIPITYASASASPSYALIGSDCTLYKDPLCENRIVKLPSSYFVTIIGESGEAFEVGYLDICGYVKKSSVTTVDYTPKSKYPTLLSAKAYNDGNTVTLRSFPDHTTPNSIQKLADGETVTYYGEADGSEQISQIGSKWYYVRTNGDIPVYGYVYNLYLTPPEIPVNDTSPEEIPVMGELSEQTVLEENGKYLLIIALCIPVLILMFIIFKNSKKSSQE